ncbi:MAG: HAD-IB family hydrolase [Acidobacteria bacterium]|nr:HAD-IB family hydrolase [Acidobacteriota bacterium]
MRAAFFDLDKTVIAKASVVALGPELRAKGFIQRRTLARAVFGQLMFLWFGADHNKMEKFREQMLAIAKGWDRHEVRALVTETLAEVIEPLIYREALELIDHHLAAGDEVWIVSSSPAEIVEPFADIIGVTGAIASRAEVDDRGRYTGRLEFFCQGDNKAVAIRALANERDIDLASSSAYSDSETDVAMLSAVGHPFAVNPDRPLARIAQENSWPTLVFSHPVRARDRRTPHTPYLVGAMVLAVLAVAGRRTRRRRGL